VQTVPDTPYVRNTRFAYCDFFTFLFWKPIPWMYTNEPPRYAAYSVAGNATTVLINMFVASGVKPGLLLLDHQLYNAPTTVRSLMRACITPTLAFFEENPSRWMTGMSCWAPVITAGAEKRSVRMVV
jgi:hypothetical protein